MQGAITCGAFTEDVPESSMPFVDPFVVRRWPGYRVCFPAYERVLDESYAAVTSNSLHDVLVSLSASGGLQLMFCKAARLVEPGRVELECGEVLEARWVIDARGPERFPARAAIGYQKFVGLEFEVDPASAPIEPTLMACSVEQRDGLRFFYVLPLAADRVLVEDTYFSDRGSCVLLTAAYHERILFGIPAMVLTVLSFFYSVVDEVFHWRRYVSRKSDPVEMWSHVGIFVGHLTMMVAWWAWFFDRYRGVAETLVVFRSHG